MATPKISLNDVSVKGNCNFKLDCQGMKSTGHERSTFPSKEVMKSKALKISCHF